jgi:hypothetical protein
MTSSHIAVVQALRVEPKFGGCPYARSEALLCCSSSLDAPTNQITTPHSTSCNSMPVLSFGSRSLLELRMDTLRGVTFRFSFLLNSSNV